MNIIEAIKSGKRFKRKSEIAWMSGDQLYNYVKADIIADDWEVEERKVTITRDQLYAALTKAELMQQSLDRFPVGVSSIYEYIAKELGV